MPIHQQQLLYHGREIRNHEKLSDVGVKDEDLIMMVSSAPSRCSLQLKLLFYDVIWYLGLGPVEL